MKAKATKKVQLEKLCSFYFNVFNIYVSIFKSPFKVRKSSKNCASLFKSIELLNIV